MGTSGLYRFDFPDAAFRHGVGKRVNLWIDDAITGTRTAYLCVMLSPPVDVNTIDTVTLPAPLATAWSDNMTQANIETYSQTGANAALVALNLDHLMKTTTGVAADGDLESFVVAGTVMAHMLGIGADATTYKASEDSLEATGTNAAAILTDTASIQPIVADLAGISEIGDKIVADMDANSVIDDILTDTASIQPIVADLAGISQIGDKIVADMDANSLLVNWTLARANIITDLAGISQIGDKIVADMDANYSGSAILTDLAGISQIGDKVVADMDANSLLVNWTLARANIITDLAGISQIGDKIVADMDANSADLNTIIADTSLWDTAEEARTLLTGKSMPIAPALASTTIASVTDTTHMVLTAGPPDNDAFNGCIAIFQDAVNPLQRCQSSIEDYAVTGGGTIFTITLAEVPAFAIAATDNIIILPLPEITAVVEVTPEVGGAIADYVRAEPVTDAETENTIGYLLWLVKQIGLMR
jgi:hypothetical protein